MFPCSGDSALLPDPSAVARVGSAGLVTLETVRDVRVGCAADLLHFPWDQQKCAVQFEAAFYTPSQVRPSTAEPESTDTGKRSPHPLNKFQSCFQAPNAKAISLPVASCW